MDENSKPQDYALLLEEGKPQKGVLFPSREQTPNYYRIDADLPDDWEGYLDVNVKPSKGTIYTAIETYDDNVPGEIGAVYDSSKPNIRIYSTNKNFVRKGRYHIGVFADEKDPANYLLYLIFIP
eukprot:CAMPEP_0114576884 /NCGR_PEP_ID=MMETSP0125-20121206/1598_1 /TAXON_ID=485358 ORGANISM="Aristerostoma sp., Strain ATCC 50986" /NCGR_SAMPLE_ID=MMETSP0125 /ASSEMBLY_ACC=CAM_ASM_000245 /LENGTH=123 /DNA_ID=CAMNT_0001765749 /DNA_START=804 /DNA_END=1175 /DNA_ORIENTATION=-